MTAAVASSAVELLRPEPAVHEVEVAITDRPRNRPFQARCSCSWEGKHRTERIRAERDAAEHLAGGILERIIEAHDPATDPTEFLYAMWEELHFELGAVMHQLEKITFQLEEADRQAEMRHSA